MNLSRRNFLGSALAASASVALAGCKCPFACCNLKDPNRMGRVGLQLYSIRAYIQKVGLPKALADVKALGYEGVQFAGYYNFKAEELKKMLEDNGLVACGTHVSNSEFSPENIQKTMDFNLTYGNKFICCPGGGNFPPGLKWDSKPEDFKPSREIDDFTKRLCDYYNVAATTAAKSGVLIGLHNHMWEHFLKMTSGQSFFDFFFSNTDKKVQMEQDVGWTACAGLDPAAEYLKYPHRSFTLHAKENGMGPNVKEFDAILGQPGKPGAIGVDWDELFPVTDADGVKWYVVECEEHEDSLYAVKASIEFLHSKGRC